MIDVAIVGAGWLGGVHARTAVAAGDRVVAVVDEDRDRAEALAAEHGALPVPCLEEALDLAFDAAIVATPTAAHLDAVTALVQARRHVLVEKPHRTPEQDPTALLAALAGAPGVRCTVGMSLRHVAGAQEIHHAIREGLLGEILAWEDRALYRLSDGLAPWYFDHAISGGGVSLTNGVHCIDRASWCLGPLKDWRLRRSRVFADHDDEDLAMMTAWGAAGGSPRVSILLMWADWDVPPSELLVVGTHGTARIHDREGWSIRTAGSVRQGPSEPVEQRFVRQWAAFRDGLAGGPGGPDVAEVEPVIEVLEGLLDHQKSPILPAPSTD
jgi:predicted dehydrogenase